MMAEINLTAPPQSGHVTINLGDLVKGLMVVIGIAVSMGRLPELKRWAAQEAFGMRPHHSLKLHLEKHRNTSEKASENVRNISGN